MNAPFPPPPTTRRALSRRRHPRSSWRRVAGVLACGMLVIALAAWYFSGTSRDDDATRVGSIRPLQSAVKPVAAPAVGEATGTSAAAEALRLIDDDGRTLWASPTRGNPLNLAYLPPGVEIVISVRPAAITEHPQGEKIIDALGPLGRQARQRLDKLLLVPQAVEQLVAGFLSNPDGKWRTALVARLRGGTGAQELLQGQLPDAVEKVYSNTNYRLANEWAYYVPPADERLFVVATEDLLTEIIDLQGDMLPLRRDVERLLSHTDADRHITMIVAPDSLFGRGRSMFRGQLVPLRDPLFWFLGDEFSAAALSMHCDDNFFVELLAVPTLDTPPERAARILAKRVAEIPDSLEEYVVGLDPHPYGRRIIARFPAMVRKLAAYTRSGFEADHAVLRCYLPAVAGHNLLMGAELTLAEALRNRGVPEVKGASANAVAEMTAPAEAIEPWNGGGVAERLRRTTSLAFPRDTLEAALDQFSRDTGIEITIAGADLQAEGITKNQSFEIDMANQPAGAILVEILRLANPDKSAAGPGDPRQKLVYVISGAEPGKRERIVITTRSAATARGDELPAVFRPKPP